MGRVDYVSYGSRYIISLILFLNKLEAIDLPKDKIKTFRSDLCVMIWTGERK